MNKQLGLTSLIIAAAIALGGWQWWQQHNKFTGRHLRQPVKLFHIEHWQTQNHVPVYFVASHAVPMVDIDIAFEGGSARDGKQWGLASLSNGMLFEDTQKHTAADIKKRYLALGANYGSAAELSHNAMALRTLSDPQHLQAATALFIESITQPKFTQTVFDRKVKQQLTAIQARDDDDDATATLTSKTYWFGSDPYAHPVTGTKATLSTITMADAQAFYERHQVAENANIILVGDLTTEQAHQLSDNLASALPHGKKANPLPAIQWPSTGKTIQKDFPSQAPIIQISTPINLISFHDKIAMSLCNAILGNGLTSQLFRLVRDIHGNAYYIFNTQWISHRSRFWVIQTKAKHGRTKATIDDIHQTLNAFSTKGPTADELAHAKANTRVGILKAAATNTGTLALVSNIVALGLPLDYYDQVLNTIDTITPQDVQSVTQQQVKTDRLLTVIIGKADDT